MPRRSRIVFPGLPHHIFQRGHSRREVFFSDSDRVDYLGTLGECRAMFGIRVYAYCLMTNHVHLIIDPRDEPGNLGEAMKRLAGRHSRRLNAERGTSGSMWEGRFKCSPIDTDGYLLMCGRYVDQNPVRARMVQRPADYPWSSYRSRAGLTESPLLDPDPMLETLSSNPSRRHEIYRELAGTLLDDDELEIIRGASQRNQLVGGETFVERIKLETGVEVSTKHPGAQAGNGNRRKK